MSPGVSLETTKERLRLDELPEHQWGRIELIQGSLTYRRDVLLQLAMPLCLVGAVRNKARTFSVEDKTGAYSLTTPSGEEHQFTRIVDVARWATANAFG